MGRKNVLDPSATGLAGGLAAALAAPSNAASTHAGAPTSLFAALGGQDSLDPETSLLLKRLSKRDTVTKLKALAELKQAVTAGDTSWATEVLPHWVVAFGRLADDKSWQVREQACTVLCAFAASVRRQLAPQLKTLITPWLCCKFDPHQDVRRAAGAAFDTALANPTKYAEALSYCREELVRNLAELALEAKEPAKNADKDAEAEASEAYERRLSTALQALGHLPAMVKEPAMVSKCTLDPPSGFWTASPRADVGVCVRARLRGTCGVVASAHGPGAWRTRSRPCSRST
jgi:hypothetical protein